MNAAPNIFPSLVNASGDVRTRVGSMKTVAQDKYYVVTSRILLDKLMKFHILILQYLALWDLNQRKQTVRLGQELKESMSKRLPNDFVELAPIVNFIRRETTIRY